jgi:hypothetical protein
VQKKDAMESIQVQVSDTTILPGGTKAGKIKIPLSPMLQTFKINIY